MPLYSLLVCLLFYILATFKVISGCVPTCDSAHSWWLYSAAPLGYQTASTVTWYPTQSHYHDTEPTSPFPILIMPSTCLGSNKHKFLSHWFDSTMLSTCEVRIPRSPKMRDGRSTHSATQSGPILYSSTSGHSQRENVISDSYLR